MSFIGIHKNVITPEQKNVEKHVSTFQLGDFVLFCDEHVRRFIDNDGNQAFITGQCLTPEFQTVAQLKNHLRNAKGTFAYVLYLHGSLIVGTDAMGFYPLYYTEKEQGIFSTSLSHLKRRLPSPKINWDAWNLLINGGTIVGRMTTIQDVFRLYEGELINVTSTGIHREKFTFLPSNIQNLSLDEYVERNNELLHRSMATMLSGTNNLLPLSSGHDSRRLFNAAIQNGTPFKAITQQTRMSNGLDTDTYVARELMDMFNLSEHHTCLKKPSHEHFVTQALEKDVWTGFESDQHDWVFNMIPHIPSGSLIADGMVGDQAINVTNTLIHPELAKHMNDPAYCVNYMMETHRFMPMSRCDGEAERKSILQTEFDRYQGSPNQWIAFTVFNRSRRNIGCWFSGFLLKGHQMVLPYVDVELYTSSMAIDDSYRTQLLQKSCLAASNPTLANLHSSRCKLPDSYWQGLGVPPSPKTTHSFDPRQVKIPDSLYGLFTRSAKESVMDHLGMRFAQEKLLRDWTWRYLPLQRLALFLEWLDTPETSLPILSRATPPFVAKRALAPTVIT